MKKYKPPLVSKTTLLLLDGVVGVNGYVVPA
jgi:hypothetical protein